MGMGPPLLCRHQGQVQHLKQRRLVGEGAALLRYAAQLCLNRFDRVGGVDDATDLRWEIEEG